MPQEGALKIRDARAIAGVHQGSLYVVDGRGDVHVVGDGLGAQQVAAEAIEAGQHAWTNERGREWRQAVAPAERSEPVMDRDDRQGVDRDVALEDEQPIALRDRRQRHQPRVPGLEVPDECRRLEGLCAVEGPALDARCARLEPNEQFAVVEQGQRLKAVAREIGDGLRVAGGMDQDGQVVGLLPPTEN